MAQLRLRVAADDLIFLSALEEELVLFGSALLPESNLDAQLDVSAQSLGLHTDQEHAGVQPIRRGLADQVISRMQLLHIPLVLLSQLLQALGLG